MPLKGYLVKKVDIGSHVWMADSNLRSPGILLAQGPGASLRSFSTTHESFSISKKMILNRFALRSIAFPAKEPSCDG